VYVLQVPGRSISNLIVWKGIGSHSLFVCCMHFFLEIIIVAIFPGWSTIGSCSCDDIWFLAFEGFTGHIASVPGDHLVHFDMLVHIF
jgi:hypothetical protein